MLPNSLLRNRYAVQIAALLGCGQTIQNVALCLRYELFQDSPLCYAVTDCQSSKLRLCR